MYRSVPRVTIPRKECSKTVKSWPPGKYSGLVPGNLASLGHSILINFTLFHHFQDFNNKFTHSISTKSKGQSNIDLSMKNM